MIVIELKELMNKIINDAKKSNASDIHIFPHISGTSFIKFRIKGKLVKYEQFLNRELEQIISLLKYNANIDISRNKEPQSGRFLFLLNEEKLYLRVSTLPLNELLEGCVVRLFISEIDNVNYSIFKEDREQIEKLKKRSYGLILFSGPTGSGKSTSMYKLAEEIAKEEKRVITIEDPVEKNIESLIQMQINEKAGINYDNGLKSILRCDPDVIVIGEIRDEKTAKQVVASSLSGHLVISTIHAEDTYGVINRLLDIGLSKEDIKQTVITIISQRLVSLLSGERELITEIMTKNQMINYINNNLYEVISLEEKFNIAYSEGLIDELEKEQWGY